MPVLARSEGWRSASGWPPRAAWAWWLQVLLLGVLVGACQPAQPPASGAPRVTPRQLAALHDALGAKDRPATEAADVGAGSFSRDDPNWPVLAYLSAEGFLRRGDIGRARPAFRALAAWGAAPPMPGADGWGGSSLSAVAMWRWLQIIDAHGGEAEEIADALKVADDLRRTRFYSGIVRGGLLPALPLLEEDIARRLARIADSAGMPEAMALLLDFLNIDSSGELDAREQQLIERMVREKVVTPPRLELFRYRRQLNQVKVFARKEEAAEVLKRLWQDASAPAEVRAEAGYEWGNFYRKSKQRKPDVVAALDSAYALAGGKGGIAEKALYRRAMVQGSVDPENRSAFFVDMARLIRDHPSSRLLDDALYQVASEQLLGAPAQLDLAFENFAKLRKLSGSSDWQDSSYFVAALGHFDRGSPLDLEDADRLLAEYLDKFPDGVFRQRCLFWRGRIAERRQDAAAAQALFQAARAEAPYDYHGLRARLHLESGIRAINKALPSPDSETFRELRAAYRSSRAQSQLEGSTPYHERLRTAAESGLYRRLRELVDGLGRRFRDRLDNVALSTLDDNGLVPAVAVLLAWRQDALAARDAVKSADNQLRLVAFLGRSLGDWPTAMLAARIPVSEQARRLRDQQNDPRYLATVYPAVVELPWLGRALEKWAWPIAGSTELGESLMYAVMREESAYFPGAISPVGALGLFQVMPLTFQQRRDCWRSTGEATPASYLFDPERNAQFWSCWVQKEFRPKYRDDLTLMLVRHHAGTGHLNEWQADWRGRAIETDFELMVDTLRFPATQIFVRHVLADMVIAEAAGMFAASTPAEGGTR